MRRTTFFTAVGLLFSVGICVAATPQIDDGNVKIQTHDGLALSGVITPPEGNLSGAVLILSGSGNVAADGDVSSPLVGSGYQGKPAKLNEQLAGILAKAGIASLRYSKRGVEDPAQLGNQTLPFLIQDAQAALQVLRERFPGTEVGIVGFSEGAQVAVHVASKTAVRTLFLLAMPTRPIDEMLQYQFVGWPKEKFRSLDSDLNGELAASELVLGGEPVKFTLLGLSLDGAPLQAIDSNGDGKLSLEAELNPAYDRNFAVVMSVIQGPMGPWYNSFKEVPPFAEVAPKVTARTIHIYHGLSDANVFWKWVDEDQRLFPVQPRVHYFKNLGHCFAPMAGAGAELRTSGPFAPSLITTLFEDARDAFSR